MIIAIAVWMREAKSMS
ncbi:MAG: hypothetical protein CL862_08220 [Cyanobium sp. NAT70]|nr:hypothetical protein [Cyanobium sp. NAT70]